MALGLPGGRVLRCAAMTVLESIQRGADFLKGKGVESPRLQAEWLLAHALGLPRLRLYLEFDRVLSTAEIETARALIQRRGRREPLQHILGTVSFCGLELDVGPQALIPRPETELLAEQAWTWLQGRQNPAATVFDFGTGTGCLAITVAVKCPGVRCHALEISPDALRLAQANAQRHGVADRIEFHLGDGFAPLSPELRFDLGVANPPYVASPEIDTLAPEVKDFDPRGALDGGADGLDYYRRLAAEARERLRPGGVLLLEMGDGQAPRIQNAFRQYKWVVERVVEDYSARPRVLMVRAESVGRMDQP